ncbi:MAG TPA: hypothetical protein VGL42_02820 [Opitutaceae bacterium]
MNDIDVGTTVYNPQSFQFDFFADTSSIQSFMGNPAVPQVTSFSSVLFKIDGDTYQVTQSSDVFNNQTNGLLGFGFFNGFYDSDYVDISGLPGDTSYGLDTSYGKQLGTIYDAIQGLTPTTSSGDIVMLDFENPTFQAIVGSSGVPDHNSALLLLGLGLLGLGVAGRRGFARQS